ncbi:MAG TPA: peptide ABC transporter substrate-binding protein [Candidatus Saccharimonadales bacterium]|nr:peptide ABC transporter substrate-binding protein [Candidatus Saccharimonadales bacterium]
MISRLTRLRIRRRFRRGKKQVEDFGNQTSEGFEENIINRLGRLPNVRRFMSVWVGLLVLLIGSVVAQTLALSHYYQRPEPGPGGVYSEGILGDFTTANPIYATGSVDDAVSRLVFAGLLNYNDQNQLVDDLAQSWSSDSTGKVYTVHLKSNLTWQDGQPLTAADVVFTFQTIQDPDSQSPLNESWQDVLVSEVNPLTVTFTLSNPLASFPYSLTTGILPKHLLGSLPASTLRTASFNTDPVGAGPFKWGGITVAGGTPTTRQEQIVMSPFSNFNGGKPKLDEFIVRAFHDQTTLVNSFTAGQLNGLSGLNSVPSQIAKDKSNRIYNLPLTAANMVFFRTTDGILADASVRRALVMGANTTQIVNHLGYSVVPVKEPLLINQIGFNPAYEQYAYNPTQAAATLQADGWILKNGIRYKAGQQLTFELSALDNKDNQYVTSALQKQWQAIGVNLQVNLQDASDFENTITFHEYDALLYGISIGVDPDVFVYWDSSQANLDSPFHTNYSEYNSATADSSLEAGRTRINPQLRAVKYQPFLASWQEDAPALGLYQPRFLYITDEPIYGLTTHSINDPGDRFDNVQNWEIREQEVSY